MYFIFQHQHHHQFQYFGKIYLGVKHKSEKSEKK